MVTIERLNLIRGLDFIIGGGFNYNELDFGSHSEHFSFGKFGFGKTRLVSGKHVTGRLEFYIHEEGISPSFTMAYHLK